MRRDLYIEYLKNSHKLKRNAYTSGHANIDGRGFHKTPLGMNNRQAVAAEGEDGRFVFFVFVLLFFSEIGPQS